MLSLLIAPSFVNVLFRVLEVITETTTEGDLRLEAKRYWLDTKKKPSGCQITVLKSNIMLTAEKICCCFLDTLPQSGPGLPDEESVYIKLTTGVFPVH